VASPEGWFEDFGEGTLAGGKADVKLDADFAALVDTSTLHVFLTPHEPQHLHVPQRTASGFSVVATASGTTSAGGPKRPDGVGTFSYRVVAKRKDITNERLAKVAALTTPKVPTAFADRETPVAKPPEVKPPEVKPSPEVKPPTVTP
jgi:hypothetical protein